jgi:hypothetical protein
MRLDLIILRSDKFHEALWLVFGGCLFGGCL